MFSVFGERLLRRFFLTFPPAIRMALFVFPFAVIVFGYVARGWKALKTALHFGGPSRQKKSDSLPADLRLLEKLIPEIKKQPWRHQAGRMLYLSGNYFLKNGRLPLAEHCYKKAIELVHLNSWQAVTYFRALGATLFMEAKLAESHSAFRSAGLSRRVLMSAAEVSQNVRSLDSAWFVAIGHMCMIDFYLKKRLLGWSGPARKIAAPHNLEKFSGKLVAYAFRKHDIDFVRPKAFAEYYDRNKLPHEIPYEHLGVNARLAMVDSFWEYDFPDGEILGYTHGAAKIQKQWELEKRPPVLALDEAERTTLDSLLRQMGVPHGAWYVCLHVREPGFHAKWNSKYPAARDAVVEDYFAVIKAITDRGGWVIRMGDPSMKPLPPMENVVDYVHSTVRCEIGDIVLAAGCKFFIGTNSGYATIPAIYGVPCVFSNWVPMALPLWFGQDLMIPKMFWDRSRQDYVGFEQIFSTPLGATQNVHDFPENIEVRDNTPEEITEVVLEMFDRVNGGVTYTEEDEQLQDRYFALALQCGSYKGSRIGRNFLNKYKNLLP
jgi:putative glycosyltransferase (TIGR04372 family)